ncbi:ABC-type sugar transport system, permease component [Candidatus Vecturithrix granuli]|uniref:ABC-type sugar transport system, permease component n=1 Tax=Vecturithrix granuli TaxID=1499967 RepID=A0A081C2X5_VECG1|nr:ABC-type sugar transport system, permease component [Candidatus Vecturithrix granuli]
MNAKSWKVRRETWDAYLLIAPLVVLLLVFILYPVLSNFYYSFTKWKGMGAATFIGLQNYRKLLDDDLLWTSLKNTGILLCYIPLGTFLPLILAAILRMGLKGWSFFRGLIYLPNVLGYVIIGLIFNILFRKIGPLNAVLTAVGLESLALDWLNKSVLAINVLGIVYGVWVRLGFGCIYFLAAMSSIDPSLYDAAEIDGAGWWGSFWNVTIPSIRFSIEFWIVLSFIEILARAFPFIYTFTRGGPGFATFTMEYAIYNAGFVGFKMGYACTWASILFVFCALIAMMQIYLMRRNANV